MQLLQIERGIRMKNQVNHYMKEYAIGFFFIALFVICLLFVPKFGTSSNIMNISTQISINGLIATGMTFVILTGGIDLSVGAVAAVTAVLSSDICLHLDDPSPVTCILVFLGMSLAAGLIFGLFTGAFINEMHVPPFIASLATSNICRGISYLYTNAQPIHGMNGSFKVLGMTKIWGWLPICVIVLFIALAGSGIYLKRFIGGRYIFSVGSSEEVSKLCGINVKKVKYVCYIVCAFFAGLAGCVYASKLQAGQPSACDGYELNAIAAVAMGGTSMNGGKGGMLHTVFGILIIGVINNALNLLGVNAHWQKIALGVMILIAVVSDTIRIQKN